MGDIQHDLADENLRTALRNYVDYTVPALGIAAYAERVHQTNRAALRWPME